MLAVMSSIEIQKYPASMAATAKILKRDGRELDVPYRRLRGNQLRPAVRQHRLAEGIEHEVIDAAVKVGAKTLVLPECGHAYMALRWMGANMYGKPLPFKVMHVSEYIADALNSGKIKVKKVDKSPSPSMTPARSRAAAAQRRRRATS